VRKPREIDSLVKPFAH